MKSLLILLSFLHIGMLSFQPASGLSPGVSFCCADDSTGTGGEIPGMGWGDTTNTTALKMVQSKADTATCYDLSGRKIKNEPKSFIIKNGKCLLIVK